MNRKAEVSVTKPETMRATSGPSESEGVNAGLPRFLYWVLVLLAAAGPISAWINGYYDRVLQEKQFEEEFAVRQLEIFLLQDDRPREEVLLAIQAILGDESRTDVMLRLAEQEIERIRAEEARSDEILVELARKDEMLRRTEQRVVKLIQERDAALADSSRPTEVMQQLTTADDRRLALKRERDSLEAELRSLKEAASPLPVSVTLRQRLKLLCGQLGGTVGKGSRAREGEESVECISGGLVLRLDSGSLEVIRVEVGRPFGGRYGVPDFVPASEGARIIEERVTEACSNLGGKVSPFGDMMAAFTYGRSEAHELDGSWKFPCIEASGRTRVVEADVAFWQ